MKLANRANRANRAGLFPFKTTVRWPLHLVSEPTRHLFEIKTILPSDSASAFLLQFRVGRKSKLPAATC
jgi:hypothetical protein